MWQSETGIVLGSVRHNDKTSVVHIFTETRGMVPFVWFLSKTGKNASRNALLQPLTQIEFQANYVPSDSLQHLKDIRNCHPYREITSNPEKSAISLFLSEFLTHALKGEQNNAQLFRYLQNALEWFDKAEKGTYSNFHISFMIGTALFLGICPNPTDYEPGYMLDLREGCFTAVQPGHPDYADANLSNKLALLMNLEFDEMKDAPLTGQQRVSLLGILNAYFRLHLPSFPVLKSIEILETVFN